MTPGTRDEINKIVTAYCLMEERKYTDISLTILLDM